MPSTSYKKKIVTGVYSQYFKVLSSGDINWLKNTGGTWTSGTLSALPTPNESSTVNEWGTAYDACEISGVHPEFPK